MSVIFAILLVPTPHVIAVFMVITVTASDIAYCKHPIRVEFYEKEILH